MSMAFSARKLKSLMEAQHLTPGALAKRIRKFNPALERCQKHHVQLWLAETEPTATRLAALAASLGVPMEELFEEQSNMLDDLMGFYNRDFSRLSK